MKTLTVVVPCYNEQAVLEETAARLRVLVTELVAQGRIGAASHVLFVDDGSRDGTWSIIAALARDSKVFRGLKLSRNCGHQSALMAGLLRAEGDMVVSIDADLQDDLAAIAPMVDAHVAGADIVYGVRRRRDSDTPWKRWTAQAYYRLLRRFGVEVVYNHADFRLMSRRAIGALSQYRESNLFLRGIVPQLGFPSSVVHYDRATRFAGESKYPLRKMLALAWQGITSFSSVPLRMITAIGLVVSLGSLAFSGWALWVRLFTGDAVPGWTSTVVPLYFLGGVQLLSIGVLGEYVAKIYTETKRRPSFVVETDVGFEHPAEYEAGRGSAP
jgi:glycosyltransferase involved in cell wall biosynthesis